MKQAFFLALIGISSLIKVAAQDTLSLESAIQLGLQNNYQIRISEKQVDIATLNNTWGNAGLYPTLSLNFVSQNSSREYINNPLYNLPDSISYSQEQTFLQTPSLELQWIVFNGFRVQISKAQYDALQRLTEGSAAITIENTLQSVILAYHLALLQEEALSVLTEVMDLSRDRYKYILSKKSFGNAVTFDVLQAETSYLADSANVIKQTSNYKNSLRNLNMVLAEPIDKEYVLNSKFEVPIENYTILDLISKLESSNNTLQNQYINLEVLQKSVELSKVRLYPVVSLTAGVSNTWTGSYGDFKEGIWQDQYRYNLNLVLSYTLSDGGNVRRTIQKARINQEIGNIQLEEMKQRLHNQMYNTLELFNNRKQLKLVAEAGLKSAKLNLEIAKEKYQTGVINSFNYRDIQIAYLNASSNLIQANFNLIDTYTELLRLSGGIITAFE